MQLTISFTLNPGDLLEDDRLCDMYEVLEIFPDKVEIVREGKRFSVFLTPLQILRNFTKYDKDLRQYKPWDKE